jgi:hypothetical protein
LILLDAAGGEADGRIATALRQFLLTGVAASGDTGRGRRLGTPRLRDGSLRRAGQNGHEAQQETPTPHRNPLEFPNQPSWLVVFNTDGGIAMRAMEKGGSEAVPQEKGRPEGRPSHWICQ